MSLGFQAIPATAGGTIRTCRFVKINTADNYELLEADANEEVVGVSSQAAQDTPTAGASANAAEDTDSFRYFPEGLIALVKVGSGGVTRGAKVKSDADGQAVLAATTGTTLQWVGGYALETASEGEFAKVLLKFFPYRPAAA